MKKILVVIANYGTKNDQYLRCLLREYASLPYDVHVVILTNTPKEHGDSVEIVLHQPTGDPWTFPFAHKRILAEHIDEYDLFIYSEDDTLIKENNIAAFLDVAAMLADDEVAGFIRAEQTAVGEKRFSTINSHFHWEPASVVRRGSEMFASFTNAHAASYILTRDQLRRAMLSGGFLVDPHQERYDLLVTAATDPYTQCGFRKLICISRLDDFVIEHLPNKYLGQFGISADDLERQVSALKDIAAGVRPATVLLSTETKLQHLRWSKSYYEPAQEDIIASIPSHVKTLLSFGCGLGELESEIQKRGMHVTAVALDSVIGNCAEARGLDVLYGNTSQILEQLLGRRFDAVLIVNLLHLVPQPEMLLKQLAMVLGPKGVIIASAPNTAHLGIIWKRVKGEVALEGIGSYKRVGMHASSVWKLKQWFRSSGLKIDTTTSWVSKRAPWWKRLFRRWLAREVLVRGIPSAA